MTSLILAALLAFPHAKAPAPAADAKAPQAPLSDDDVRQRVNAYLGSIDTPIAADRWRALGTRAADVLEPIARSESELPTRRAKAVAGLVLAAPARAAPLVARYAQDEKQPLPVRIAALRGVGRMGATASNARALSKVLRTARNPNLRGIAAEVIAASGSSGCAQVKAQVAREEPDLRGAFRRALARCGE